MPSGVGEELNFLRILASRLDADQFHSGPAVA